MRVCVLVHQFPVRSETFIVDHVAGLLAAGHSVTVIPLTPRRTDDWTPPESVADVVARTAPSIGAPPESGVGRVTATARLVRAGVAPIRFARDDAVTAPGGFGRRLLLAARVAADGPFDVVHAQFATTASAAAGLRRHGITAAPVLVSVHGQDVNTMTVRQRGLFVAALAEVARVTVGTRFMRDTVVGFGVPADKVTIWPQGVAIPDEVTHSPSEDFRVLSVGRLVEFKGVDDSLRVIAAARPHIPRLRYTVVGDGPERPRLAALARELGVDDITSFVGARNHTDVLQTYGSTDAFLHMARVAADGSTEGQGVAPAEASAAGLAVVGTFAGGLPEVIRDGETGLLVPIGDIEVAGQALVRLYNDGNLRKVLGEEGRRFVGGEYSEDRTIERVVEIYSGIS